MMAKNATANKVTAKGPNNGRSGPVSRTPAPKAAPSVAKAAANPTEPEGEHVDLMTPAQEDKMREQATKPAAVKAAIADGKKDPIAKFGDPDADQPDIATRRANFG